MLKFLSNTFKVLVMMVLITITGLIWLYIANMDAIFAEARARVSWELSKISGKTVSIGSVNYTPLLSLSFKEIQVFDTDTGEETAEIGNIIITPDIFSMIKKKGLFTTLSLRDLETGDMVSNALIRVDQDNIFIIEAEADIKNHKIKNITGTLQTGVSGIPGGKLSLTYGATDYIASFKQIPSTALGPVTGPGLGYDVALKASDTDIGFTFIKKEDQVIIKDFSGKLYSLNCGFNGVLRDFSSPAPALQGAGFIEADLKDIPSGAPIISQYIKDLGLEGTVKADFNITTRHSSPVTQTLDVKLTAYLNKGVIAGDYSADVSLKMDPAGAETGLFPKDITRYSADGEFFIKNSSIGKVIVNRADGKISLDQGRLRVYRINGKLYDGIFKAESMIDLEEDPLPYYVSYTASGVDFRSLINDLGTEETGISGTFSSSLTVKGYAGDVSTLTGDGSIDIKNANLGPMPIMTPILGEWYSQMETAHDPAEAPKMSAASCDFTIKNRKVKTKNLLIWSDTTYIKGLGSIDFGGELNFWFQNEFRDPDTVKNSRSRNSLRDMIVRFGKNIGRAHLTGTVKDQKWSWEWFTDIS